MSRISIDPIVKIKADRIFNKSDIFLSKRPDAIEEDNESEGNEEGDGFKLGDEFLSYNRRQGLSGTDLELNNPNLHKKNFNITSSKNQKVVDLQRRLSNHKEGFIDPL